MPDGHGEPLVTIVIPTYDRPAQLELCLASIAAARRPGPTEVIVVDDGGSVPLGHVVAPFRASLRASIVRQENGGPGAARNAGVARARGRHIVFVDDDCWVGADTLVALADGLSDAPDALIGGRTVNLLPENPYSAASQAIVDAVYAFCNPDPTDARFFATNNMAVGRTAFLACGGFDERFTLAAEDREFCDRWRFQGRRLVFRSDAIVGHAHDLDFGRFARQHLGYGRSAYTYHRVRARRGSGRMSEDFRFHVALARRLLDAARHTPPADVARGAALVAVWQAANGAGWASAALADGVDRFRTRLAAARNARRRIIGTRHR